MSTNSLIIDLRAQLPWHRRYMSTTSTAVLWGAWFLLWRPMLVLFTLMSYNKPYGFHRLFNAFWFGLQMDMITLLTCAAILCLWCKLIPAHSVKHAKVKSTNDYARHFDLPEQEIVQGRQQKVTVVHHNEQGQIIRVE
ncbi:MULTISPECIES: poly-beta-1,6-N-acetyl-D-glucosamine biosynthesis protein PgaD [Acinetobacter]|uniref:Poly-beta-1,6-N-acetyl-D-glucosamine biosynthesis protein PgaD n=1 Tax=Acinetobacter brisouii CIP 110357 TaxID=1341683 RepID=V2UMY6_9GAMM|nr:MULTISPECIES: poly-beta-1,6-N-acetyl-D-glucosamine biosynthesis protein PgaD [Acinetobacter]PVZ90274.1 poly-beta-1,6-N-acetyl-D-glucosamine biosynthesis protein PgaD [Serratia sp. S1B]ENV47704.1 poly-beta-1,6-N-acetyl-D-glucosamine biosynthesis protein PgaD [Acinetobacter brisouii ANC 4119]ESK51322.1 poly-beta-1,6-N-acetyl-D-glucosamine biosynthesis protein PgaD [Acinetobacter brisouii CIP 110357]KJV40429.1 poly-beta-1,6-N-acetyl-D-glucosamine biosynthesis protein PgaD [Acinetobacter brisoui